MQKIEKWIDMSTKTPLISAIPAAWAILAAQVHGLNGRVLEAANMEPVPGAVVVLNGADTTLTDVEGRFSLTSSPINLRGDGTSGKLYHRFGSLFLLLEAEARVKLEIFDGRGMTLAVHDLGVLNRGETKAPMGGAREFRDRAHYARIEVGGDAFVRKILPIEELEGVRFLTGDPGGAALAKTSLQPGSVAISAPRLNDTSVAYANVSEDLGDIVLSYPPRVLGVGAAPPYGAVVLFDGSQGEAAAQHELGTKWHKWAPGGKEWPQTTAPGITFKVVRDPEFLNDDQRWTLQSCCHQTWGYDDLVANEPHGDVQLHVEWNFLGKYDDDDNPDPNESDPKNGPHNRGAGYNNSGVYVQSRYEIQLQSVQSPRDPTHGIASLVDDKAPSTIEPMRANGEWQAFDITFRTSRWNGGNRTSQAYMTVYWNGVKVHDNVEASGRATGIGNHSGEELNPQLYGLKLQSEGTDVRFRNIWMKKLTIQDAQTDFGY